MIKYLAIAILALSFTGCGSLKGRTYDDGFTDGMKFITIMVSQEKEEYKSQLQFYKQLAEIEQTGNEAQVKHWRKSADDFEKMLGEENE